MTIKFKKANDQMVSIIKHIDGTRADKEIGLIARLGSQWSVYWKDAMTGLTAGDIREINAKLAQLRRSSRGDITEANTIFAKRAYEVYARQLKGTVNNPPGWDDLDPLVRTAICAFARKVVSDLADFENGRWNPVREAWDDARRAKEGKGPLDGGQRGWPN